VVVGDLIADEPSHECEVAGETCHYSKLRKVDKVERFFRRRHTKALVNFGSSSPIGSFGCGEKAFYTGVLGGEKFEEAHARLVTGVRDQGSVSPAKRMSSFTMQDPRAVMRNSGARRAP
jgi:hypothetical protein